MPRIVGINIPDNKQIWIALSRIYGIGRPSAKRILKEAKIDYQKKAADLSVEELTILKEVIEKKYKIEGDLKRKRITDIKRLKDIHCWRGLRHSAGLPVRGQTSRINSRTVRGNVRKTVGSGKKKAPTPK